MVGSGNGGNHANHAPRLSKWWVGIQQVVLRGGRRGPKQGSSRRDGSPASALSSVSRLNADTCICVSAGVYGGCVPSTVHSIAVRSLERGFLEGWWFADALFPMGLVRVFHSGKYPDFTSVFGPLKRWRVYPQTVVLFPSAVFFHRLASDKICAT